MLKKDNPDSSNLLRLEMLSQLALPEKIFLAAFLTESHQYLTTISNSYCNLNEKFQPTDIYDEVNHHSLSITANSHIKKNPRIQLQDLLQHDHVITNHKSWQQHSLAKPYRKIFFRQGYHQSLILPVSKGSTVNGLLIFNRDRHDAAFNTKAVKQAKLIRNQLESGFQKSTDNHNKSSAGYRSGLIIVDHRGEMTHCCLEGYNLLSMALQKREGNLERISFTDVRNLPGVIELINRLLESPNQETNVEVTVNSHWGSFQINGFPVLDQKGNRSPQIYLNITWQLPFSLMLFHKIRKMEFTPKQQLIGLLYASGSSTKTIANRLEVSLYTVKEHVQHIFQKLDIHSRAELIEQILCHSNGNGRVHSDQTNLNRTE